MIRKQEGFVGQRSAILPGDLVAQVAHHPLCESLYITDIGYYPHASFHDRERKIGCSEHILIYCVQGAGWFESGGARHVVQADHFFILPAHQPHSYGAHPVDPWTIYWVHFAGQRSGEFLTFLQSGGGPVAVEPRDERLALFEDIMAHMEMAFNDDNLVYANHALAHFLTTLKSSLYSPTVNAKAADDSVSRTIAFMKQHLDQNLTLAELAGVANMSNSHYSAVFREKVQRSPIHFFTFLKMQKASRLLKYGSLRINEIAEQLGYRDPFHFSRVFTGVMGVSPRDFRRSESN
ncbi:MAG: AraC family transcriptional regulator [Dyadobacter fermentans]